MFDKIGKVFYIKYLLFLYHCSCLDVSFYFLVHCNYFRFSKWRPSAILDFDIFACLSKIQMHAYFYVDCIIWWRSDDPRPNCCVFSIFKMASVRYLGIGMTS